MSLGNQNQWDVLQIQNVLLVRHVEIELASILVQQINHVLQQQYAPQEIIGQHVLVLLVLKETPIGSVPKVRVHVLCYQ